MNIFKCSFNFKWIILYLKIQDVERFSKACCYKIRNDFRCFEHLKRETKKLALRRSRSCCLTENRFSFKGSKCFVKVSNWLMVKAVTKGTEYPSTRVNGKSWNYLALIVGKRLLKDKLKKLLTWSVPQKRVHNKYMGSISLQTWTQNSIYFSQNHSSLSMEIHDYSQACNKCESGQLMLFDCKNLC